jgi:hypothetical protein
MDKFKVYDVVLDCEKYISPKNNLYIIRKVTSHYLYLNTVKNKAVAGGWNKERFKKACNKTVKMVKILYG